MISRKYSSVCRLNSIVVFPGGYLLPVIQVKRLPPRVVIVNPWSSDSEDIAAWFEVMLRDYGYPDTRVNIVFHRKVWVLLDFCNADASFLHYFLNRIMVPKL